MQYNDSYNETMVSFANNIHTPEGGMHETGFKTALTRVLNAYGHEDTSMLKDDDKVSGEDCREGLTCVISVKLTDAQFEGQTKAKLGNSRDPHPGGQRGHPTSWPIYLEENPGGGPDHPGQGPDRQPGPGGRPKGPGVHPPQDRPGRRGHAGQAAGLQRE